MSGYTPVFDSVFQGTLCGKWPTLPIWLTILPLADKNGRIDMTPEAIGLLTGWPLDTLKQGLAELCSPDPRSRSKAEGGARLKLIDPEREWGWQVVNHSQYREKARLLAKTAREVEEGRNRARMQDRRSPPKTAVDPPSNSNAYSNKNSEEIFGLLLKTSGKEPARTDRIQAAIDKVGGWPKIRNCTEYDLPAARRAFCEAYDACP